MNYHMTIVSIALHPPGVNPVYGEEVTRISLANEGGGYFFELSQVKDQGEQTLRLQHQELAALAAAGQRMLEQLVGGNDHGDA